MQRQIIERALEISRKRRQYLDAMRKAIRTGDKDSVFELARKLTGLSDEDVIELIRVSTEQQAGEDRAGIPAQRDINRRTAHTYGLTIVKRIEIVDVSGSAVLSSPQMQGLLRLMESPEIHGVVTKEFSRLMRPEKFTDYALLQQFIDTATVLYLPDGPIDLASKSGRLLGTIRAALAGLERREIIERLNDAKESMRRVGKHPGGESTLPYGVTYSPKAGWSYTADAEKVRTAFRLFLSGETSYMVLSQKLHIPRTNVRFILENPIYTGWRVYREKRDPSAIGYVSRPGGQQGYRRKIQRSPDEVIRVRVLDAMVSEADFNRAQHIIGLKKQKHWRSYAEAPNRYTYNGFLTCADCASLLYTHTSKDEFYVCKSRNTREARLRATRGLVPCSNPYMLRKKLEPKIDFLLGQKLREPEFLSCVVDDFNAGIQNSAGAADAGRIVIGGKLADLEAKRQRILEAFFDGAIDKQERDSRIAQLDMELSAFRQILLDSSSAVSEVRTEADFEEVLEPLAEWEFLERDDKRALLAALCPEIRVERYVVKSLMLNLVAEGRNEVSRNPTAGASPPGRCAEIPAAHPGIARRCAPTKLPRAAAPRRPRSARHR
jgi:DNA invertase Pin-like site-specific DNA recombinase